jgi:hypothetical protein
LPKIDSHRRDSENAEKTIFLFGAEPFDRLKALSKAEGRPPNEKASVPTASDLIPKGAEFLRRPRTPEGWRRRQIPSAISASQR